MCPDSIPEFFKHDFQIPAHPTLAYERARQVVGADGEGALMKLELESETSLYPFVLTEDQEHLRREIREFTAAEIAPNVMAWDEASEFPMAVVQKLRHTGLL